MLSGRRIRRQRITTAPGQYLGYSLQCSRMLDHLLRAAPGDVVSLEVLGDVATKASDGSVLSEEGKSRRSRNNPVSDRAVDFWKTIRNWVDDVTTGRLDPARTRFRLYISRPFDSNIASQFANASSRTAAHAVLKSARAELASEPADASDDALSSHLQVVFSSDPHIVASIIEHFEIESGTGSSIDDLKLRVTRLAIPPELGDDVLRAMLGWVKVQSDSLLERDRPASIAFDEFHRELVALVRRLDSQRVLASVARQPSRRRVTEHLRLRTYVRQMELIELDEDDKRNAVIDFLKTEADRIHWAVKGRIHSESFNEFESDLISAWKNYRRRCTVVGRGCSGIELGVLLYGDCGLHAARLQGIELPGYFCRGSFHALADVLKIGWHPEFSILLRGARQRDANA